MTDNTREGVRAVKGGPSEAAIKAGRSDKYGQVYVERVGNTGFRDPNEPIALIRAQDKYALRVMAFYESLVGSDPDVPVAQRESVSRQVWRIQLWQAENPVRTPGTTHAE